MEDFRKEKWGISKFNKKYACFYQNIQLKYYFKKLSKKIIKARRLQSLLCKIGERRFDNAR